RLTARRPGRGVDGARVGRKPAAPPDSPAVVSRENARGERRVQQVARAPPVIYVAFDLLFDAGEPLLEQPLHTRRARLAARIGPLGGARIIKSDGVVGRGEQFFAAVRERGLEGMVGKRLDSRYRPGERSPHWPKIN